MTRAKDLQRQAIADPASFGLRRNSLWISNPSDPQTIAVIDNYWARKAGEQEKSVPPIAVEFSGLARKNIAMGRLGDWLTDEPVGTPGVYACSNAVADELENDGRAGYLIVNRDAELTAVSPGEAAALGLAEVTELGAQEFGRELLWHAESGARAVAARAAKHLRDAAP